METDFIKDNYRFILRASAIIYSKDKSKVLLHNIEGKSFYLLPGGRIDMLENSYDAIKREIIEEVGWDNLDFELLAFTEEFINYKGQDIQRINIIYKTTYEEENEKEDFKGLEGDYLNFKWVNIKDLDNYNLYPEKIKEAIKNPNKVYHFIETDLVKDK